MDASFHVARHGSHNPFGIRQTGLFSKGTYEALPNAQPDVVISIEYGVGPPKPPPSGETRPSERPGRTCLPGSDISNETRPPKVEFCALDASLPSN